MGLKLDEENEKYGNKNLKGKKFKNHKIVKNSGNGQGTSGNINFGGNQGQNTEKINFSKNFNLDKNIDETEFTKNFDPEIFATNMWNQKSQLLRKNLFESVRFPPYFTKNANGTMNNLIIFGIKYITIYNLSL